VVSLVGDLFADLREIILAVGVLDCGEALDVMDFVEDDQGEDLADAGHGTKHDPYSLRLSSRDESHPESVKMPHAPDAQTLGAAFPHPEHQQPV